MKNVFIALLLISFSELYSQNSLTEEYFPMQIGNIWEYYNTAGNIYHVKVIGDTLMPNGKTYRIFKDSTQLEGSGEARYEYYRTDSVNVWKYSGISDYTCDGDFLEFKLDIPERTIWKECVNRISLIDSALNFPCLSWSETYYFYTLDYTGHTKVFGGAVIDTIRNDTSYGGSFYYLVNWLTKGIGKTMMGGEMAAHVNIKGAVINGIQYGTLTSVETESNQINYFQLYQNYPNPFNPTTTISYSIPYSQIVELKVYDLLGNEVAELVNEYKPVGNHSVNFNANSFSSGVYFCKLKASNFIQIKKLILLK